MIGRVRPWLLLLAFVVVSGSTAPFASSQRRDSIPPLPSQPSKVVYSDSIAVPDHIAYLAVLRTIGRAVQTQRERAYVRRMLMGTPGCVTCVVDEPTKNADLQAILTASNADGSRLRALDQQALVAQLSNASDKQDQLRTLNIQRASLALEFRTRLAERLSKNGFAATDDFVKTYVKSRITMLP